MHAAVPWTSEPSGKVPDTFSMDSITDHGLVEYSITKGRDENTNALTPVNLILGILNMANLRSQSAGPPLFSHASAPGNCCGAGHPTSRWKDNPPMAFTDRNHATGR